MSLTLIWENSSNVSNVKRCYLKIRHSLAQLLFHDHWNPARIYISQDDWHEGKWIRNTQFHLEVVLIWYTRCFPIQSSWKMDFIHLPKCFPNTILLGDRLYSLACLSSWLIYTLFPCLYDYHYNPLGNICLWAFPIHVFLVWRWTIFNISNSNSQRDTLGRQILRNNILCL